MERNQCPFKGQFSADAMWFTQNVRLETLSSLDRIAEAVRKIKAHSSQLSKYWR